MMTQPKLTPAARKMRSQLRKLLFDKNPTNLADASALIAALVDDSEMAPVVGELSNGLSFDHRDGHWGWMQGFRLSEGSLDEDEQGRFLLAQGGHFYTSKQGRLQIEEDSEVWKRCKVPNRVNVALHILRATGQLEQRTTLSLAGCRWGPYIGGWGGGEAVPLVSIEILSGLTELTALDLQACNELKSFRVLASLTKLADLNLMQCRIHDGGLKALSTLPALEVLHLAATPITKLGALANLSTLTTLGLGQCRSLKTLDGLSELKNLENLDLHKCAKITDIEPLSGLTGLKRLSLQGCEAVRNVDALAKLMELSYLNLEGCRALRDISALEGHPNLDYAALQAML